MDEQVAIFMVEGGKPLELVREHIAARKRVRAANAALMDELKVPTNTEARVSRMDGKLVGVKFPAGTVPKGWTKPDRKHGVSYPKKGTEWAAKLAANEGFPEPEQVISKALGVPLHIEYSQGSGDDAISGSTCLGPMLTACGWLYMSAQGPYAMWVPDVPAAVKRLESEGYTVDDPAKSFSMQFEGCRRILQEEWDLMVARRKLEEAQEGATTPTAQEGGAK